MTPLIWILLGQSYCMIFIWGGCDQFMIHLWLLSSYSVWKCLFITPYRLKSKFSCPSPLSPLPVPRFVTALSPGSCPFTFVLPFIMSLPSTPGSFENLITGLSSTLSLFSYHLFGLPLSFTVTPLPPRERWHRKGQLTDLKTPESRASLGLDLICINLHNLVKAEGDAVHTVPWDTSERNSPLRIAVIMVLSLLTTVGGLDRCVLSEKCHVAWLNLKLCWSRESNIWVRWPSRCVCMGFVPGHVFISTEIISRSLQ